MTAEPGRGYWERHAKRYDASTRILSRPIPRMLELVVDSVRGLERVLEVAAGTGLVTTALATVAKDVIATDYADAMVAKLAERAAQLANVRCERADVYALSYEPNSFDAVVAANVLHLVPDLDGALAALRRMLKPDGVLIVPTYCHAQTFTSRMVSRVFALTGFPGKRRFTAKTLHAAIEHAGFRVRHAETLPGVIPIGYVEAVL